MKIYAQMDDFVLVKINEEDIIPFGFVINWKEKKIINENVNFFSLLKGGDWEDSNLSLEEKKEIIILVEEYMNQ